jgi:hypothetical protein
MMQFILDEQWSFPNLFANNGESRMARFRCSAVMVGCILPGLSPTVTNGLPLIRCRTVTWSWLESGLLLLLQSTPPEIVSSELNPLEGIEEKKSFFY